jgi:hypothetical protein
MSDTAHAVSADVAAAVQLVQRLSPGLMGDSLWNAVAVVLVHVREGRRQQLTPPPAPAAAGDAPPRCPVCQGAMRDQRATKRGNQPDFKCSQRACDGAMWLDRKRRNGTQPTP